MSGKFLGGVVFCLAILAVGAFAFGVFEEANDGPIENAVETIDSAIK